MPARRQKKKRKPVAGLADVDEDSAVSSPEDRTREIGTEVACLLRDLLRGTGSPVRAVSYTRPIVSVVRVSGPTGKVGKKAKDARAVVASSAATDPLFW